ncbi:MAG TPA: MFS transporter [Thermoanaerobaculia bacterium]|nr:MFS transporter [Thermoanaerobaculia bacterium]
MSSNGSLRRLGVLMAAAFVDMLGGSMLFSQLPFYATRYGATPGTVGMLISAFFLAQLVTAPFWGRTSDRHGRRPAILAGLSLSMVAFTLFGISSSDLALETVGTTGVLALLFLTRFAQGAGGGTAGVLQAYVSDATAPEERTKALGWVTAAISCGVMVGPQLGSEAVRFGPMGPGILAASLCLINLVAAWRWLPESSARGGSEKRVLSTFSMRKEALEVFQNPGSQVASLIWAYALGMLAFFSLNGVLGLYLKDSFAFTERTIGTFYTYVGGVTLIVRAFLIGPLVKRVGEVGTLRLGALAITLGLLTVPFAHNLPMLAVCALFMPVGTALLFPATSSLISQQYASSETGRALGVQQAFGGVARLSGPLWATYAYGFVRTLPFLIAGAMMVLVTLYTLRISQPATRSAEAA